MYNVLRNNVSIPKIILGTYSLNGDTAKEIFNNAYEIGYRGFDCARFYGNEADWGAAFKESGVKREDIFIQTKVNYTLERKGFDVIKDFEKTLSNFRTNYIDAYLIHWPVFETFLDTWSSLEKLYEQGKVRAIGVCNFRIEHFRLLEKNANIMPMIAQFERHPCRKQDELFDYCLKNRIQAEAYSPLAVSKKSLTENETLNKVAKKHNCSVQQIALAWNIQTGVIPLPRTSNISRLSQNFHATKLTLSNDDILDINNNEHYFRALTEYLEFPGYWDQIHKVNIDEYL